MRTYIIRRVLLLIPTFLLLTLLVFLSVRFLPGDVIDFMMARLGQEVGGRAHLDRERIERMLGLDVPAPVQYARWLGGIVLRGTPGRVTVRRSYRRGEDHRPAADHRRAGRPRHTHRVGHRRAGGHLLGGAAGHGGRLRRPFHRIIGLATPNFWLATLVLTFPAIWWAWAPPLRMVAFVDDPLRNLGHLFIPSLILGTYLSATVMRMTRTMMLEVLPAESYASGSIDGNNRWRPVELCLH